MGEIAHPHDKFLKALMDQPGVAGAFLRERLPKVIAELLAPGEPELVDGSFVDPELRASQTDRLYRVRSRTGRPAFIYCLVEHKSAPARRIALQLLVYLTRIWAGLDDGESLLPPIVPLVLYHGETEWRVPRFFANLLDAEDSMRPFLLDFPYVLVDLGAIPDAELSSHRTLRAGLAGLKYALRQGQQLEALEAIFRLLKDLSPEFRRTEFIYMIATYRWIDRADLRRALRKAMPEREDEMLSIAAQEWKEEWKAEGRAEGKAEGKAEGRIEGRAQALLRILSRRFGEVPPERQREIEMADLATLDAWIDRAIDASSLHAVFEKPPGLQ